MTSQGIRGRVTLPHISWWRTTPWAEINAQVQLMLSRKDYLVWLQRSDVRERMELAP